ncbi:hypothetical protein IQ07DRAFT_76934 [Pyrenochaeta sp. DS3sAY3a]|nr:hypothetical protein IQ07DRAFT_76934 [Pyrenochaeta sp. DS3sAY3a]
MKRKNTTSACETCRKRKAKCDGNKPLCSRCGDRGLPCSYSLEQDGRRPAPKSYVELLRARIELLERTLKAHSLDVEESSNDAQGSPAEQVQQVNDQQPDNTIVPGSLSRNAPLNFERDGEARYFGLSSGRLEFVGKLRSERGEAVPEEATSEPPPFLSDRFYDQIAHEQLVSQELEDDLIDSYFRWEQPWAQAVDEKLFRESRAQDGKYFSRLLLNCILAVGSRVSLREETRSNPADPSTAGYLFLEKAEMLLHFDLKKPTITTLQSLCILGVMSVAVGHDAVGWLHAGMADRLALDMGLNFDSASVVTTAWLTGEEIELRRRIYWTLYCIDKSASMYTGRVCSMLDTQADVALPAVETESDISTPYEARRCLLGKIQRAYVRLQRISERILLALYNPKPSIAAHQKVSFIASAILDLKNWHYDLPRELSLESNGGAQNEPAVYVLHMLYHTVNILLMKPSLLKTQATDARKRSHHAATEICSVATKYRRTFGSFRLSPITATHCTLSAALILLRATNQQWEESSPTVNTKNIGLCLRVLEELSVSWNPAKRIRQNLQKLLAIPAKSLRTGPAGRESISETTGSKAPTPHTIQDTGVTTSGSLADVIQVTAPNIVSSNSMISNVASGWRDINPNTGLGTTVSAETCGEPYSDIALESEYAAFSYDFTGALDNFSYMETNPVFQFDFLPDDYSSFDILNGVHVYNMQNDPYEPL